MQEPDGQCLFHPERDLVPANLCAPKPACGTCTIATVLCCTHSVAFTRLLTLQVGSNTSVLHRGKNAAAHTQMHKQPEDASLPMTSHMCTGAFSKEQIRTHMHSSPCNTALGCAHIHIHIPCIDTWSPLPTAGTCTAAPQRCSPEGTHSCTPMCTHDTTLSTLPPFSRFTHGNTDRHMYFCVFQVSLLASTKQAQEGEAKHL